MLRKSFAVGFCAIGLSLLARPAQADTPLPGLTNLNFLTDSGSAPKGCFTTGCNGSEPAVSPTGWTGGNGLIFITDSGTSSSDPNSPCGSTYLQTYGCPSTLAIPGGYNEVEADGNPVFESGFNTLIKGLSPSTTYTLSFYQAASQQTGFNGNTTEQWIVALGGSGFTVCNACGPADPMFGGNKQSTYADAGADIEATTLMSTPSHGLTDWEFVSVNLTTGATVNPSGTLLSFLAWGDDGTTNNLPPMVFLTGVNSPAGLTTPEPASVVLFGSMLLGIGAAVRRRLAAKV
jgi:hypothetical protein